MSGLKKKNRYPRQLKLLKLGSHMWIVLEVHEALFLLQSLPKSQGSRVRVSVPAPSLRKKPGSESRAGAQGRKASEKGQTQGARPSLALSPLGGAASQDHLETR